VTAAAFREGRRRAVAWLAAQAAVVLAPRMARAHRSHVTLSRIAPGVSGATWEIEHHFHQHDADAVLQRLTGTRRVQLTSPEGRARIALHVEESFALQAPGGQAMPITTAGADFGSDSMVVYQECAAPDTRGQFRVTCRLFQRFFDDQENHVSVDVGATTELLTLSASAPSAGFDRR
jgi:hypothetical protein